MAFADTLATLPTIDHLQGLNVLDAEGNVVHHIPNAPGKAGSLRLYHALAQQFNGELSPAAAQHGLTWFGEHVADALAHPGAHPNIDLLLRQKTAATSLRLQPVLAA